MKKQIIIVDCYGLLFRAYHSMPPLTNKDGTPVGAVYGVITMLLKILSQIEHTHIVIICDSGSKSFRNDIYPEYKAHRPPAPEDLVPQFALLREAVLALGLKLVEKIGFEADDLIATFATEFAKEKYQVVVVSSDKDLMQLIKDDSVVMYDAMKNKYLFEEHVQQKFGVLPNQLLDLLALVGDSADNIPGVPSIGPKTATELLLEFNDIESIYENIEKIQKPKRKATLIENKDKAFLSKTLVRLKYDVDYPIIFDDYKFDELSLEDLIIFLEAHNFQSLIQRVKNFSKANMIISSNKSVESSVLEEVHKTNLNIVTIINNIQQVKDVILSINEQGKVGIAFNINQKLAQISDIYLTIKNCTYIFKAHQENWNIFKSFFEKLLSDSSIQKIGYNLKHFCRLLNISKIVAFEDLDLMIYLLGFKRKNIGITEVVNNKFSFEENNDDELKISSVIFAFYSILRSQLIAAKLYSLYANIDKPMIPILLSMEIEGVTIDRAILSDLSLQFTNVITDLEEKIFKISDERFNISSPKQLGQILFEKLQIKSSQKGKSISTNVDILEELEANGHEIASLILKWRHYTKLKNTYIDTLPKFQDSNGRIHTSYNLTLTSTGRLSSTDPNLQNIPIKTEDGKSIRKAFIAKKNFTLIKADYSQIELRILAHKANVTSLINAFLNNHDIHNATAADLFNVSVNEVDSNLRRKAKAVNFGIIYGMSAFGLAKQLNISRTEAKQIIDIYFEKYPEIKKYMNETIIFAQENNYVTTLFNRKCYLDFENAKSMEKSFLERAAINAPIQGTQADIIKIAMIKLQQMLEKNYPDTKMLLQIHDELIFETPVENAAIMLSKIQNIMENCIKLVVPLKVDINIQTTWY
jgi:DNA polymerase I